MCVYNTLQREEKIREKRKERRGLRVRESNTGFACFYLPVVGKTATRGHHHRNGFLHPPPPSLPLILEVSMYFMYLCIKESVSLTYTNLKSETLTLLWIWHTLHHHHQLECSSPMSHLGVSPFRVSIFLYTSSLFFSGFFFSINIYIYISFLLIFNILFLIILFILQYFFFFLVC